MKFTLYQSKLKTILDQRNGYLVLAMGSLTLCILLLLLIFMLVGREKVILVPSSMDQASWVTKNHVSSDYLSKMTLFFAELTFNTTSDNVSFQQELLLRYVDPAFYGALKTRLVLEADRIKQQHLATVFFPVDVKVDAQHLEAVITGDLKSFVGEISLPVKRISYRFAYRIHDYQPLIQSIEEMKEMKEVKHV